MNTTPGVSLAGGQLWLSRPACVLTVPFTPADAASAVPAKFEVLADSHGLSLLCVFQGTYSASGLAIEPAWAAEQLTGLFWLRLRVRSTSHGPRLHLLSSFVPDSSLIRIHGLEGIRARMVAELHAQL